MIPHVTNNDEADITELEAFRVADQQGEREVGRQGHDAGLRDQGRGRGAEEVSRVQRQPRRRPAGLQAVLQHRLRRRHAQRPGGAGAQGRRQEGRPADRQEMGELAKKARDGKLGAADMQGGCFSISSLGGIGGTHFTPIINAPEVAILGLSKGAMKPVWDGKAVPAAPDAAAVAVVRPPRDRRRAGRALQRLPGPGPRRLPPRAALRTEGRLR